jgi:hypothetical protein
VPEKSTEIRIIDVPDGEGYLHWGWGGGKWLDEKKTEGNSVEGLDKVIANFERILESCSVYLRLLLRA